MCAKRVQAIISGKVTGVGFRFYAAHVADRLHLVGTVRNLPSGEIEAVAEGEEETLNLFIDALRQGPTAGRVDDITAAWAEPSGQFQNFVAVS
jgi:acylphosphatase